MMTRLSRLGLYVMVLVASLLGLGGTVQAEQRLALVIGNGLYDTDPVNNAGTDAVVVAAGLQEAGYQVTVRTDLSRQYMTQALDEFVQGLKAAGPDSLGVVYFVGKGRVIDGENYLLPLDGDPAKPETAISLSSLLTGLQTVDNRLTLVVLDANTSEEGLREIDVPRGLCVMYAAPPGEKSQAPRGLFARFFGYAMSQPGKSLWWLLWEVDTEVRQATNKLQGIWYNGTEGFDPKEIYMGSVDQSPIGAANPGLDGVIDTGAPVMKDVEPNLIGDPKTKVKLKKKRRGLSLVTTEVTRYPTLDVEGEEVTSGETLWAEFWLSTDLITPEVSVKAEPSGEKAAVTADGALQLKLPDDPQKDGWTLKVVLAASGFTLEDGEAEREIFLPREDESEPVMFNLRAKEGVNKPRKSRIRVTLWHEGEYLARVWRDVTIYPADRVADAEGAAPAPTVEAVKAAADPTPTPPSAPMTFGRAAIPDLTVHMLFDNPGQLGTGQIIVASPHFRPPSRLVVQPMEVPPELGEWLGENFIDVMDLAQAAAEPSEDQKSFALLKMRGLGCALYRHFAPAGFKKAFDDLAADPAVNLQTIQIFSNDPLLPWEIMVPSEDCSGDRGFLAVDYQLARWHLDGGPRQREKPVQSLEMAALNAVVPRYEGENLLPFQETEVAALRKIPGFKQVPGTFSEIQALFQGGAQGVVHFSGHGLAGEGLVPDYAVQLEGRRLDVATWRALTQGKTAEGTLFFFNACEVGRAESVANFVDGWGPAVLDTGASGFVGGLWPVVDRSAADFAARFYDQVDAGFQQNQPVKVSEALRQVRQRFLETGDPTYLAYAYYGDVNLVMRRR
ncbi:MAG: caspase family protein [Magnetospiraceae bacterium]